MSNYRDHVDGRPGPPGPPANLGPEPKRPPHLQTYRPSHIGRPTPIPPEVQAKFEALFYGSKNTRERADVAAHGTRDPDRVPRQGPGVGSGLRNQSEASG